MVNDVDVTEVQEGRSARQQEVIETTDEGDDSTLADHFVGTMMSKYGTIQSTRTRKSPPSYTLDFSDKCYKTYTLYVNVYDPSTVVMSR